MSKKLFVILTLAILSAMVLAACQPAAAPAAEEAPAEEAPAEEAPAEEAPAAEEPAEKIYIAMAMHHNIPYVMQMKAGFDDFCATVDDVTCEFSAPNQIDPEQSIAMFQNFVTKGAQGVIVNCVPADVWVEPIKTAMDETGVLVASLDVACLDESGFNVQVGPLYYPQAQVFSKAFFDMMEKKGVTSGQVVFGMCAPGYESQESRNRAFLEECEARGGYECIGSLDSGHAADLNYSFWENINTQYPDAVAFAGSCAFDGPNLFKLKAQVGGDFWIGTYDLEPETLDGLKAGDILAAIGNNPHLNGFLAGKMLYEHVKSGEPLVTGGVISTTPEVVTFEDIDVFMEREASPEARLEFTMSLMNSVYTDIDSTIEDLYK